MEFEFKGAAQTVTGSKHIITTRNGKKILLDCGLFQGKDALNSNHNKELGFKPEEIDYCILSHAHIDHSGAIPYLIKRGYKGLIYCTEATKDLCEIMLVDSAHIQESDAEYKNKKRTSSNREEVKPLYTIEDAKYSLTKFKGLPYGNWIKIDDEIELYFTVIGHILGAAATNLKIKENGIVNKVCYTGDIGRPNHRIIKQPKPFPQADYIITEATYGNRLHDNLEDAENRLLNIVTKTCVEKKGKLIIPAFSLGRTQEIVYALDQLETAGKLPNINVYVDSPLSTNATEIVRSHPECFNQDVKKYMQYDSDPFGFNRLHYIKKLEQSKLLNSLPDPCIIISASGMMEAGRILHHLKNNIEDKRNTLLIVGYCEPSTLGGRILKGNKTIKIFGEQYNVNADIEVMEEYSAHGDYQEMISYLSCQDPTKVKEMFLVHGNYEVQQEYRDKLIDEGYKNIRIPSISSKYQV
jgi:metallo-beta-lactamase family protein